MKLAPVIEASEPVAMVPGAVSVVLAPGMALVNADALITVVVPLTCVKLPGFPVAGVLQFVAAVTARAVPDKLLDELSITSG